MLRKLKILYCNINIVCKNKYIFFTTHNDEFNHYIHSRSFKINPGHRKFGGVRGRFYEAHEDSLLLSAYFCK